MGTNFYAVSQPCENACAHCSAGQQVHIGKSWTMFEAHEESPWGPIGSWEDWKRVFRQSKPMIRDEYGDIHSVITFIGMVEMTDPEERRRQYDWVMKRGASKDRDYLDSHGFSWHRGEFS